MQFNSYFKDMKRFSVGRFWEDENITVFKKQKKLSGFDYFSTLVDIHKDKVNTLKFLTF